MILCIFMAEVQKFTSWDREDDEETSDEETNESS